MVQFKQKIYYDQRARSFKFDVGDKVLLLLPTDSNKLYLQWKGPYEMDEKSIGWTIGLTLIAQSEGITPIC